MIFSQLQKMQTKAHIATHNTPSKDKLFDLSSN